jgi:hypothetical protein
VTRFGRPDATGRSSGKLAHRERNLLGPPPGGPWIWLTRDLLESAAWRGMSRHCFRFVTFLAIEHCNHAGRENGRLQATYDQLRAFGINRKRIAGTIREAVQRGLVAVERKGGLFGLESHRTTSLYRLTWIGVLNPSCDATNEWRRYEPKNISRGPHAGTAATPKKLRKVA